MTQQRREYFRINYPITERPSLITRDRTFEVIDVSEYGVRFKIPADSPFLVGEEIRADIRFPDDEIYICNGQINRHTDRDAVILLGTPIPLQKIRSEQTSLIIRRSPYYS